MSCRVSEEQLWSWVDRQAPELEAHLADCARCRALAAGFRAGIQAVAADSRPPELRLPKRIGSYAITGLLGEGGQGIVYRAEQESPKRPVALKVLKGSRVGHFRQEIQSLARLNHPAIATIFEADETELGQHFFAMELVDGVPLDEYVRAHGLALPQRLDLFCKVCAGVQYAHEHDVIHRDLKPSNILINAVGDPKILDFGLARLTNADVTLTLTATETGKIVGTLRYMSPEQARGDPAEIDARTDVYSLGVVLYELMTDRPPFEPSSLAIPQAMATICETPPRRPSAVNRALRGDLEIIVLKALEKERSQRYQSVAELCQDVGRYLRGEPIRARPPSGLYVLRKKVSKHRLAFGVGAAILLLSAVGIVGTSWSNHRRRYDARYCILLNQRAIEVGSGEVYVANARTEFDQHPEIPEARLVYAQAMFATGLRNKNQRQCNDAATLLQEAQGIPGGWAAKLLLGDFRRTQGDTRAEREQAEGLRDAPDTDEGWYVRSYATLDTVEAQRCVATALRRNARHELACERLACLALQNRDYDGAMTAAETLMRDFRYNRAEWTMFKVAALNQQGRYEEAMKLCAAVAALSPVATSAYVQRGLARLCLRDYAGAAADYSHIIDQWGLKEGRWVYYRRATVCWCLRQWAQAAADCRALRDVQGRGSYATARLFLALHEQAAELEAQGRRPEADRLRAEAREALADGVRAAVPESWQANVLRCLGGELAPADLVAAANPRNPEEVCEGLYYAGERCLLDGDRTVARQWFERCRATNQMFDVDQWPLDPMNEYHLAIWRLDQFAAEDKAAGSSKTQPAAAAAADGG